MGLVTTPISLKNPRHPELPPIQRQAMADSGALHLCIPAELALELRLDELPKRKVSTADGKSHECAYVGPILIKVCDRECFTGALVLGDEILLGAVPMEDMDLWISPARHTLVPNPASPDIPLSVAKGFRVLGY
jgi:clan AA aspartic protease